VDLGTPGLIRRTLTAPPDSRKIVRDAADMREKLAAQFPGKSFWDLKFTRGGLVDIEFIVQTLQLLRADATILSSNTVAALDGLCEAALLDGKDAEMLAAAYQLQLALTQVLRIAVEGAFDATAATPGLKTLLARAGGEPDFVSLEAKVRNLQAAVSVVFEKVIVQSAA
jgi:glutamate-ammonia-ligase adenylyltransferase